MSAAPVFRPAARRRAPTGWARTACTVARLVIRLAGSRSEIRCIERPVDDPAITLARDKLGWEPRTAPVDGLRRTIDWFRAEPADAPPTHPPGGP
ncbi:hypothetical protein [Streptomyces bluensis]|uniref:Uncharacterized protein n=1 Tax=Streptomyces bluensis TaxID=33897 RepID=A0ABW6UBF0_9ACTN